MSTFRDELSASVPTLALAATFGTLCMAAGGIVSLGLSSALPVVGTVECLASVGDRSEATAHAPTRSGPEGTVTGGVPADSLARPLWLSVTRP